MRNRAKLRLIPDTRQKKKSVDWGYQIKLKPYNLYNADYTH